MMLRFYVSTAEYVKVMTSHIMMSVVAGTDAE